MAELKRSSTEMSMTPENATTWRDLVDLLSSEQVEDLEEYDSRIDDLAASAGMPWQQTPREALLGRARRYTTENMLDALIGDVPTPAGAEFVDTWQEHDPQPYRILLGAKRSIEGHDAKVWTSVAQFADGSIDQGGTIEPPHVHAGLDDEDGMTADQARQLAAALIEAAAELDGWTR
jgi:hypothetical protein